MRLRGLRDHALTSFRQACECHRSLEFVDARFAAARSLDCQRRRIERQVRHIGRTAQRFERHLLTYAELDLIELPNSAAHFVQSDVQRHDGRSPFRPNTQGKARVREPGPGLPGMADRLRCLFENLEQPFNPSKILGRETALEVAVIGEDQSCERGNMGRRKRRAVADRVAVRRLAGDDRNAGSTEVQFRSAAGKWRHEQPAGNRSCRRGLRRLRTVLWEASPLSDRSDCHDVRAGRKQHRLC